jgi:long-subunit fatty acid transport protein
VKGLYGIGEAGQITFTTGLMVAGGKKDFKESLGADKVTSTMIPLLAGYRHNFSGFYAEPQIGYGIYSAKIKGGDYDMKDSQGAFTWAIGGGYKFNDKIEAGLRYQSMHKDGGSSGFFGVRVGYLFSLSSAK